ncbi:Glycosyltransferase WbsX [Selenomonas ruminantium]|uniref:Glycosyltransferase WbsX n=2 Tax=Selenomonas ruminantium TaxID=971 RepID=A0A1I0YHS7_SELRU|nr:Glycosyltransferase WbsX [Selenomonas ruminantium]
MSWQADLARRYGIDGFSFYHYWFKDGRQILERPAENLLEWKDVDMPFCFTWANETWARTWSNFSDKNVWVTKKDLEYQPDSDGVLLRQTYGQEEDWLAHIRYLIPFFKDARYIRFAGKPVFIIYKPDTLHCWPDMRECWEQELHKEGIAGLYVIGEQQNDFYVNSGSYEARLWRFPARCLGRLEPKIQGCGVKTYDYDEYWRKILDTDWRYHNDEKSFYCVTTGYDDTPRHGSNGVVLTGAGPAKFGHYLSELLQREVAKQSEYVFINAWNEWGEGAYLEPDEENGYGYLQAVLDAKKSIHAKMNRFSFRDIRRDKIYEQMLRYRRNNRAFDVWMSIRERGGCIADWLEKYDIREVAIYGLGYLGRHLLVELKHSHIEVKYVIDKKADNIFAEYPLYNLRDDMPKVDAIIITPAGQYDAIRCELHRFVSYKTISLEHILTEFQL